MNKSDPLPVFGVGPFYGITVIITSLGGVLLAMTGALDSGSLQAHWVQLLCLVLGVVLSLFGFLLWFPTAFGANSIDKHVRRDRLCTTGVYRFVRNPCYSGLTMVFIGLLLIAHNLWLWVLPPLYWLGLTVLLKNSEEKWLLERHGQEYLDYCKNVNRCIPWFPKKSQ